VKNLFLSLLRSQSEEEVKSIIENHPLLSDPANWRPYGGTKGNYSSFENQQSTAEGALMEKLTNSIDAILVRQSLAKGIDPSSKDAPNTMEDAVSELFTDEEREKEHVSVFVDGEAKSPNIMIMDEGEGQEPDHFDNTLLSLQRGNKNSIKFVQGKFNMGSTGAAVFCGKHKFQLIASKRHSVLSGSDEVGFTIVRKHVRTDEEHETMKNTWYEYFVLENKIPRFSCDSVDLFDDERFHYTQGTIVKMFNYKLSKKSAAFQSLKEEINNHLYFPAFPIEVHETRKDFKQVKERNSIMNVSYGNGNLLRGGISTKLDDILEFKSLKNSVKSSVFGQAEIDVFVFKEEHKREANVYRGNKPIVFLMNGQVQYHLTTSFISNDLGFKLIKDHMVVSIDCTKLKKEFLDEGFFMANRETIRDTEETRSFIQSITTFLKNNQALINLNKVRASKKVSSNGTKQLFERLLGKNKNDSLLRNLFQENSLGTNTKYNSHLDKDENRESKELGEFPSYMKIKGVKKDEDDRLFKALPLGKKLKFSVEMDVVNNYFTRQDISSGEMTVKVQQFTDSSDGSNSNAPSPKKDVSDWFDLSKSSLDNGEMDVALTPNTSTLQVGDEMQVTISVADERNTFEQILYIRFEEPVKNDPTNNRNKKREKLTLPPVIQVFKDQDTIDKMERSEDEKKEFETWEDRGWDEETGKNKIVEIAPGVDNQIASAIYINMSSPVLHQIITEEGTSGTKIELAQEQFLTNLYLQSFIISASLSSLQKDKDQSGSYGVSLSNLDAEKFVEDLVLKSAYAIVKLQINNLRTAVM